MDEFVRLSYLCGIWLSEWFNNANAKKLILYEVFIMKIQTIAYPKEIIEEGCGECKSTCQSACKTSCTVGNQSCDLLLREHNPEKEN